jgi:hypothetical protein
MAPSENDLIQDKAQYQQASASTGHVLGVNLEMLKETYPPLLAAQQEIMGADTDRILREILRDSNMAVLVTDCSKDLIILRFYPLTNVAAWRVCSLCKVWQWLKQLV